MSHVSDASDAWLRACTAAVLSPASAVPSSRARSSPPVHSQARLRAQRSAGQSEHHSAEPSRPRLALRTRLPGDCRVGRPALCSARAPAALDSSVGRTAVESGWSARHTLSGGSCASAAQLISLHRSVLRAALSPLTMSQARKRDASQMDALAAARLDARLLESDSSASDDDEPLASRPAPVRPMLATHTKKKPQRSLSSDDDVRSRAAPASATAAGGDSHNSDVEVIGETIVSKHPKPMAKHTKQKKPQSQKNKVAAASAAKKTKQTAAAAAAASSSSDAAAATSGSKRRKLDSGAAKKSILKRAPVPMPSAESADDSDGSSASRSAASSRDPSPAAKPAAAGKGKTGRPTSKTYRAPVVVKSGATAADIAA